MQRTSEAVHAATQDFDNVETAVARNYEWPEDSFHFRSDGSANVPPPHDAMDFTHPLMNDRFRRLTGQPSYDALDA